MKLSIAFNVLYHVTILTTLLVTDVDGVDSSNNNNGSIRLRDPHVTDNTSLGSIRESFENWMQEFNKEYENRKEFLHRLEVFTDNHLIIEFHNNKQNPKPTYQLGHNQFSDMTWEEYKEYNKLGEYSLGNMMLPRSSPSSSQDDEEVEEEESNSMIKTNKQRRQQRRTLQQQKQKDIPSNINWVEKGALPPIKNQGMCGSCWAFSAIGAIEGKHYIDTGDLIALSEQELLDCDPLDMGCGGGLMDNAFLFDENSTGICSEIDYPYVQHKRWFRGCATEHGLCQPIEHTRVKTFIDVPNTINDLMDALSDQPVSVAIEADQHSFQFYKSGVYSDPACGNNLDHGVIAVGYGTTTEDDENVDPGIDYFIVRNSWGPTWGDEGYIKMARISDNVNGTCGILSFASRPILRDDE